MFPQLKRERISEESLLVILRFVATDRSNECSSLKIRESYYQKKSILKIKNLDRVV